MCDVCVFVCMHNHNEEENNNKTEKIKAKKILKEKRTCLTQNVCKT